MRERGRGIEVFAVARTGEELNRARTTLDNWAREPAPSEFDAEVSLEIARIEHAIVEGDDHVLDEYEDLQAGLERIVELMELQRTLRSRAAIDCFATWRSTRLPGGWS